ncbi:MAG: vanadium nitrogenase [Lachnospiraceae bacterium]
MGFWASLLWYSGLFIFLAAVAVAGIFTGRKLRNMKDAKDASENQ